MVQEAPTSSPVSELWLPLKEVATPSLYRNNAFRILGLPITASTADIKKQQQQLRVQRDLGIKGEAQFLACLPLESSPDANLIRQAVQRLADPAQRLVNELFWFWPANLDNVPSDTALQLLAEDRIARAVSIWESQLAHPVTRHIARHNLAVFHHALALDYEQTDNSSPSKQPDDHWNEALPHWSALIADESFWKWIAARIRQINDQRLTLDTLQQLRHGLPQALIIPNVTLAGKAMRQDDLPRAKRHHSYLVGSSLGATHALMLLENELRSVRDSLRTKCEQAMSQLEETPAQGATIAADLLTAHAGLCDLLPEDSYLVISASNALAEALRACAIAFGNATHNWARCRELSAIVHGFAQDTDLRSRAEADIKQLDENIREAKELEEIERLKQAIPGDCVYEVSISGSQITIPQVCPCCLGTADAQQQVSGSWEESHGTTRHKRTISWDFPICADCRMHQQEYAWKRWLPTAVAAATSTGAFLGLAPLLIQGEPTTSGLFAWDPRSLSLIDGQPLLLVSAGEIVTTALFFACNRLASIRPLSPEHACRTKTVYLSSCDDFSRTFVFHNPLYARAFASGNHTSQRERHQSKPSRTSRILAGGDLVVGLVVALVIAGIAQWSICGNMQDERQTRSDNSTASKPTTPSTPVVPAVQPIPYTSPTPVFSAPALSTRIDALKAKVREGEKSIDQLDADMDAMSPKINSLAAEIEQFEKNNAAGLYVNRTLYQNVIDEHNAWVARYNAKLKERKAQYAEYQRQIADVNDMVRRYNGGER